MGRHRTYCRQFLTGSCYLNNISEKKSFWLSLIGSVEILVEDSPEVQEPGGQAAPGLDQPLQPFPRVVLVLVKMTVIQFYEGTCTVMTELSAWE